MLKLTPIALFALALSPVVHAQEAGAVEGPGLLATLFPFLVIGVVFYFLLWRPQSQQRKRHQTMLEGMKKGDRVVTQGGVIGKVVKVTDQEVTVEIADNVRVRVVKGMIIDVSDKSAPVAAND